MENKNIGKKGKGLEALISPQNDAPWTADEIFIQIVRLERIDKKEYKKLIERIKNFDFQKGSEQF